MTIQDGVKQLWVRGRSFHTETVCVEYRTIALWVIGRRLCLLGCYRIQFSFHFFDDDDEYDNFYGAITQHMPLQACLDKTCVVYFYHSGVACATL